MIQEFKFTCFKGILNVHLFRFLCIASIEVTKGRCYPCIMLLKTIFIQSITQIGFGNSLLGGCKHYLKVGYDVCCRKCTSRGIK